MEMKGIDFIGAFSPCKQWRLNGSARFVSGKYGRRKASYSPDNDVEFSSSPRGEDETRGPTRFG